MAKQVLQIGAVPNDGTGDTLRVGADKLNDNFNEVYAALGNTTTLLSVVNNNLELDVAGKANKISFLYDTEDDLPNAAVYHGAIAHVHTTGSLYYAHSGGWVKLVSDTSNALGGQIPNYENPLADVAYQGILTSLSDVDLVSAPPQENDVLKYDGTSWVAGEGGSAVGSLGDLTDVDLEAVDPQTGMVLKYDGTKWVAGIDATTGGGGSDATTLNGQSGTYYLNWDNFTNTPNIPSLLADLTNVASTNPQDGQALVWNAGGNTWEPGTVASSGGGGASYDQDLNTTDDVEFNSVTTNSYLTGGTGTPTLTSGTTITLTAPDGVQCNNALIINGLATLKSSTEVMQAKTNATNTVEHDISQGQVFYHSSITGTFIPNFTNVPTIANRVLTMALILQQGSTAYIPTAIQIDGVPVSAAELQWQDGTAPSGNASQTDVITFSLIRNGSSWVVTGSLNTYAVP